jgi:hypothetical protein
MLIEGMESYSHGSLTVIITDRRDVKVVTANGDGE